jgi:hypothetical protein
LSTPLRFELVLTATAEVRDKDGNLISNTPVETTALVTEKEAAELLSALNEGESR